MKITKSQLKQIIREEIRKIQINEQQMISEDWMLAGDIALGIVGGIAGLYSIIKIGAFFKQFDRSLGQLIATKAERAARSAAKKAEADVIASIANKFKGDSQLESMFASLPPYNNKKESANVERRKQLTKIAAYIKSKLNPEEMKYFKDVSSALRGTANDV